MLQNHRLGVVGMRIPARRARGNLRPVIFGERGPMPPGAVRKAVAAQILLAMGGFNQGAPRFIHISHFIFHDGVITR